MATQERKIPTPETNPETKPFWEAAAQGRLLIKKCLTCGRVHFYPRAICPLCGSDTTEWVTASGCGTVYSYSVMRRVPVPYALAYVQIEEGVSLMTTIVSSCFAAIWLGLAVTVTFQP